MCLQPVRIYNNAKYIDVSKMPPLTRLVPCGKCEECRKKRQNDWTVRAYYHAKETIDNGGYIVFETLTYSDDTIPRASEQLKEYVKIDKEHDFTVFRKKDVQDYLKRLRKRIGERATISYYIVSEYGTDPRYTHRPHYHAMFYVNGKLDPEQFSLMSHLSWQKGRTDGIVENGVLKFRSSKLLTRDTVNVMAVSRYISKYINKSSDFEKVIDKRLNYIINLDRITLENQDKPKEKVKKSNYYRNIEKTTDYAQKLRIRKIKNKIVPFHLQSIGFGTYAIKCMDNNDIEQGTINIPDKQYIKKTYALPAYIQNKIYKKKAIDKLTNEPKQIITWKGRQYYKRKRLQALDKRFNEITSIMLDDNNINKDITYLLNGRNLFDYVKYEQIYRNRIKGQITSPEDIIEKDLTPTLPSPTTIRLHTTPKDKYIYGDYYVEYKNKFIPLRKYINNQSITEKTYKQYEHYDAISIILKRYLINKRKNTEKTTEILTQFEKKWKQNNNVDLNKSQMNETTNHR